MLISLLSNVDKAHLLKLGELLSICDKPLLWDGKTKDEVTPRTNMKRVAFATGASETKLLGEWSQLVKLDPPSIAFKSNRSVEFMTEQDCVTDIELLLLVQIGDVPLKESAEDSVGRVNAVSAALHHVLRENPVTTRHAVRIMLYELILMALAGGGISSMEYRFLEIFKNHHQVEDRDFDEILGRAETTYREVQKTISLILE